MAPMYTHEIETSTDGEVWQPVAVAETPEEHDGGAGEYAAAVLAQWLEDEHPEGAPVDGDGNPLIRCRVYPAGSDLVAGEAYPVTERELWSGREVAEFLGVEPSGVRRKLSRWGVPAAEYVPGPSGRVEARYDPVQVRQAAANRPGRGHRTDLDT